MFHEEDSLLGSCMSSQPRTSNGILIKAFLPPFSYIPQAMLYACGLFCFLSWQPTLLILSYYSMNVITPKVLGENAKVYCMIFQMSCTTYINQHSQIKYHASMKFSITHSITLSKSLEEKN